MRSVGRLAALLAMLPLSVVPASVARSGAESQRPPAQVELSLSFTIDRTTTECNLAVPPTISGTMLLSIDFVAGTVVGSLEGEGSGEQGIPSSCTGRDGTDIYRASTTFSGTITRDAEDPLVGGLLEGFVDATTGEFVAHAIIDIEGSGSHGIPGVQYSCPGVSGLHSECPIGEAISPQPATISGRIQTGQEPVIEDGFTSLFNPDGTDAGTISNVDNPTLHRTRYWRRFNVLVPAGGQNFDLQPLPAGTYLTGPKTPAGTPVYHPESGRYLGLRT